MTAVRVLAVDLGAGSARIAAVTMAPDTRPLVEVVHRYPHQPVRAADGSLRWAWDRLLSEVVRGLALGLEGGPVASIGVDTWGVDYGLLDDHGELLSAPHAYRSERTAGWQSVAARLDAGRLYRTTGIQLMGINTIFQLSAHDPDELSRATQLLLLPELIVHALTGAVCGERTSAGTTGLVDLATGTWAPELVAEIGVDPAILPAIEPAGRCVGTWRGVPVHIVGGHDTASAVAASEPGAAFVASGTWMLVGIERPVADVSDAARTANFSNEPGVAGGFRFLKNVMGLWMLERLRAAWGDPPLAEVLAAATGAGTGVPVVDATDERFLAPADMDAEVRSAAGLSASASRGEVARCVLESLAAATANVVAELGSSTAVPVREVCLLGGGAKNPLLRRLIEEQTGVSVRIGPVEATAIGNALVQGVALGVYDDLADARSQAAA